MMATYFWGRFIGGRPTVQCAARDALLRDRQADVFERAAARIAPAPQATVPAADQGIAPDPGDSVAESHPATAAIAADAAGPSQAEPSEINRPPTLSLVAPAPAISISEARVISKEAVPSSTPTADPGTLPGPDIQK